MSEDVYIKHYYQIEGFKDSVKTIQRQRNELINEIIEKLDRAVQEDQFRKYKSVATLDRPSPLHLKKDVNTIKKKQLTPS